MEQRGGMMERKVLTSNGERKKRRGRTCHIQVAVCVTLNLTQCHNQSDEMKIAKVHSYTEV